MIFLNNKDRRISVSCSGAVALGNSSIIIILKTFLRRTIIMLFFFIIISVGCLGQLARTTIIPLGPLSILQAQGVGKAPWG